METGYEYRSCLGKKVKTQQPVQCGIVAEKMQDLYISHIEKPKRAFDHRRLSLPM